MADKELKKADLVEEAERVGVSTEGTKAELEERLEAVESGTMHVPDTFAARFDPANPPAEDPGPVVR